MTASALFDWIDDQYPALVKRLVRWCHINSGSYNLAGLADMATEIETAFNTLGAEIEWVDLPVEQYIDDEGAARERELGRALKVSKEAGRENSVLLVGHMDTVFSPDHSFQQCEFIPNRRLHGPGAADMKGGILVMLTALQAFEQSAHAKRLGWEVLITPDEEIGSPGAQQLLADSAQQHPVGLVYEPTMPDATLAGARSGSCNFDLVVEGRSAHAGREYQKGRNAVAALARITTLIDGLNGQREGLTVNVARIIGGGPTNVVPDRALLRLNVRIDSIETEQWLRQSLASIVTEADQQEGFKVRLHDGVVRPAKPMTPEIAALIGRLQLCGHQLGIDIRHVATGGVCDGNNLAAAGLPNIDTLGVVGGGIHSAAEYVELDSLCQRAKLSTLLLINLAEEPLEALPCS